MTGGLMNASPAAAMAPGAAQMAGMGSGITASAAEALTPSFATSRAMGAMADKMMSNPMAFAQLGQSLMGTGDKQQQQQRAPMPAAVAPQTPSMGQGQSFSSMAPQGSPLSYGMGNMNQLGMPQSTRQRMMGLL
jgi:hypothetical protein